jgi:hypothetical protein
MRPQDDYDDGSGAGLRVGLLIAAVALGIPLFVVLILYASGTKLAIVHNDSAETVEVAAVVHNGAAVERTTVKAIDPHRLAWIVFTPRLQGGLTIFCKGSTMFASKAISSVAEGTPAYSSATFESCNLPPHFDKPS